MKKSKKRFGNHDFVKFVNFWMHAFLHNNDIKVIEGWLYHRTLPVQQVALVKLMEHFLKLVLDASIESGFITKLKPKADEYYFDVTKFEDFKKKAVARFDKMRKSDLKIAVRFGDDTMKQAADHLLQIAKQYPIPDNK